MLNLRPELMEEYEAKLKVNREQEIKVMKINFENECERCHKVYNVNVSKKCPDGSNHSPKY
jgi:nitrate/TMAO reductase-like tetraheme cytochrome c subunit